MTIYILNLIIISAYSAIYNLHKKHKTYKLKKLFVTFITIQLILVLSLRDKTIGVDVQGYVHKFKYLLPYMSFDELIKYRFELGFKALCRIIGFFTSNEQIFLSIIAIFTITPIGRFIYKYSKMPFLSFALYISMNYYSFTFSGLRQAIAYAIIFSSYDFIKDKKIIKFVLIVGLASLFHKSALVFLPAYFLANLELNKITITGILIFDTIIFVFRRQIYQIISNNFYASYELVESSSFNWMLICSFIIICGLIFYKRVILVSKDNNALYIYLIIGASLMIFASTGTNIMRVADYYYMFVILFIPEVLNAIKDKKLELIIGYILITLIFVLYVLFLQQNGFGIVPYRFFWQ